MTQSHPSSPLISFLQRTRSQIFKSAPSPRTTYVLGNPSADLDSFISAVLYAFVRSRLEKPESESFSFIPLVNLPAVPSTDLWRLRPEFSTALRIATHLGNHDPDHPEDESKDKDKTLLQHLITIHDLQHDPNTKSLFPTEDQDSSEDSLNVILVDHNAVDIPNLLPSAVSNLNILGCIDHHVDESKVPPAASPRIIRTGIGSCTSLVVLHLRDEGLWPSKPLQDQISTETSSDAACNEADKELAIVALAPILVDTANLTAAGKVSDTDRLAVTFLEDIINDKEDSTPTSTTNTTNTTDKSSNFSRQTFFNNLIHSKESSLDNLTLTEIFSRDYKEWTETPQNKTSLTPSPAKIKIGISSSVRPISYLLHKADSPSTLISSIKSFSTKNSLSIFALMTTSHYATTGSFERELLILAFTDPAADALSRFIDSSSSDLGLEGWTGSPDLTTGLRKESGEYSGIKAAAIWHQRDVSKSRKQVAPMLREAVKG